MLNIANSSNEEKILYDIYPILNKARQSVTSDTSTATNRVAQNSKSVKRDFSLKGGISATELFDTVDNARKGKKKAVDKLSKYVDN